MFQKSLLTVLSAVLFVYLVRYDGHEDKQSVNKRKRNVVQKNILGLHFTLWINIQLSLSTFLKLKKSYKCTKVFVIRHLHLSSGAAKVLMWLLKLILKLPAV